MKKSERGFADGVSLIIVLVGYMLIKIGADEIGQPEFEGPHYTEKSAYQVEQETMQEEDHILLQMKENREALHEHN